MNDRLDKKRDERIQRAVNLMHEKISEPLLGVPDLAKDLGLSVSYFSHLFRDNMGVGPAKFLKGLRMQKAEYLIKTTSLPLGIIFDTVGITDRSHFIRSFTLRYGLPPSRYRLAHRTHRNRRIANSAVEIEAEMTP